MILRGGGGGEQEEEEAQAGETYETKLSTSSEYSKKEIDAVDGSEYYGNEFVDSFLKIEKWLDETPPIPGELFRQWIKGIYQDNLLIQNKMYVGNKHVSLDNLDKFFNIS